MARKAAIPFIAGVILIFAGLYSFPRQTKTVQSGLGSGVDNAPTGEVYGPPRPSGAAAPASFPSDRALTREEVFQLAQSAQRLGLRVDAITMTAIAFIESSFQPWAVGDDGRSIGLMQTQLTTAADMYAKGYRQYPAPTVANLKNPVISMYYGASYIDWLEKHWPDKNLEWYIRAYNGGPGHNYNSDTTAYWEKFLRTHREWGLSVGGTSIIFG